VANLKPNEYLLELNEQLTYLFAFVREINELDMAGALFQEFRGMQAVGWRTVLTAHEVFKEMRELVSSGRKLTTAEYRQFLCLYVQLSEAGGIYETLLNLIGVAQSKPYNMWPFQDLVKSRNAPRRVIGPNSNAMFRKLSEESNSIGMNKLSLLLEMAFRDDIRNGISHADYIIWDDGLRLPKRNGGSSVTLTHAAVRDALNIGMLFFELFDRLQGDAMSKYRPAKEVVGQFSENPPMLYTVEFHKDGMFSISTESDSVQTNAKYERQQRINSYLHGTIFTAFFTKTFDRDLELLEAVRQIGFEVQLVEIEDIKMLNDLKIEIDTYGLWAVGADIDTKRAGLLFATPFGFEKFLDIENFRASLPLVQNPRKA
jgi:hypothetical protein